MRRMPKLVDLLFEAPEDDLKKFMDTPLSQLDAAPAEKLPPEAKELVAKPTGDDDKQIQGSTEATSVNVLDLYASQNEVGMVQSLKNVCTGVDATWDGINWGDSAWLIEHMKPGVQITFKDPLLGANTKDGKVVLDGHHRWSQAFMVNPECSVNVVLANASSMSADDVLKAVHLAILKKTGQDRTKGAEGGNLFNATEADVKGYLEAPVKKVDPTSGADSPDGVAPLVYAIMQNKKITDKAAGLEATIKHVMSSIARCRETVVSGSPSREKMPQADNKTNPVDAATVMDMLSKGEVNYNEPFSGETAGEEEKPSANESRRRSDAYIMERWGRLAGILKD